MSEVDIIALREARVSEQAIEIGHLTERIMVLENLVTEILTCIKQSYKGYYGAYQAHKVVIPEAQLERWSDKLGVITPERRHGNAQEEIKK